MGVLDNLAKLTGQTASDKMGQAVEEMVNIALRRRRAHERRWFDNNFFDDGYHFRVVSKKTGRVIDTTNRTTGYMERAIPRASRQIRGVSNLLFSAEPYPVVYPERISESEFPPAQIDPQSGKEVPDPQYEQAVKEAKERARKQGIWLSNNWTDEQRLNIKLIDAIIKAAKNSVSWIQVYSDPKKRKIFTSVYDAFDLVCYGDIDDVDKLPFMTKTKSMELAELKSSPLFSPEALDRVTPDNKYATSEIKEAYMRSRYGAKTSSEDKPTVILKETFIQEYLTESNWEQASRLGADTGAMEGKNKGDPIMRQIFSAGGVTLEDTYVDYDHYPFVPIRFEPGSLYQVPFIERFIPQNKSLDVIVTRLEKWVNSMVVGVYQRQKGENMQISNFPGGQLIEYQERPLTQMNMASPGNTPFEVIELMNKYIEEQGASTSVLGQLPSGVHANKAIENLQQQEYANLKIPTLMLKDSIKRIAELMLERADKDFLEPVEVSHIADGNPEYFDVIGSRGMALSQNVNKKLPQDVVPLSKDTKVRIEIEAGLGLTMEGKKEGMLEILKNLMELLQAGFIAPEAMQQVIKRFLETYGYGSTEEFMEALDNGITAGQMSDNQIQQMQIAMLQVMKDAQVVGPQADNKLVMASKVGTLESLKEAGLLKGNGANGQAGLQMQQKVIDDMAKIYKDSPPDVRRQIEMALGMQPSSQEEISPVQAETVGKLHSIAKGGNTPNGSTYDSTTQQSTQ